VNVGDIVKPVRKGAGRVFDPIVEEDWIGLIVGIFGNSLDPYAVVYWNSEYPREQERMKELEVVNEM